MAVPLHEPNITIEQCSIPDRATVIFDWDNTLKVINVEKKCIESRVKEEFLEQLLRAKHCTLYIISAIQPSRINLSTILFEVDKLGLRKYFCSHCQKEINNCENLTCSSCDAGQQDSLETTSLNLKTNTTESSVLFSDKTSDHPSSYCSDSKQEDFSNRIPWDCHHKLDMELFNGEYKYARWGNIVISGYDKAEVFLELSVKDKRLSASYEFPPIIDLSVARQRSWGKSRGFQFESDFSTEMDGTEEADGLDEVDDALLMKNKRHVIFFDDEKVNIDNFKAIVKYSHCYLVG